MYWNSRQKRPQKGKNEETETQAEKNETEGKIPKKIAKEHDKRLKAETELKYTKLLLQNHGSLPESFYVLQKRGWWSGWPTLLYHRKEYMQKGACLPISTLSTQSH